MVSDRNDRLPPRQENHDPGLASSVNTPYLHQWIQANKLSKNEHLQTANGTVAVVVGGTTPTVHDGWMWDLTVPGNNDHDFYVLAVGASVRTYGGLAGATPILVHNTGPDCGVPVGGKNGDALGSEDFHGSDYSLDEIVGFVNGHTGDANPAMGRPTEAQIETTLRQAGPVQLAGQNASRFDYNGVRVIVNWDMPWKSTAYYPGK